MIMDERFMQYLEWNFAYGLEELIKEGSDGESRWTAICLGKILMCMDLAYEMGVYDSKVYYAFVDYIINSYHRLVGDAI